MKKEIDSILIINRYLSNHRNDDKKDLIKKYLDFKLGSLMYPKFSEKKNLLSNIIDIPMLLNLRTV